MTTEGAGKPLLIFGNYVKPQNKKTFRFIRSVNQVYTNIHPVPLRGASAIVTNEGRVAVDADCADNERHESVRRSRVVLTPHCWRRRWQQYMAHRGERKVS